MQCHASHALPRVSHPQATIVNKCLGHEGCTLVPDTGPGEVELLEGGRVLEAGGQQLGTPYLRRMKGKQVGQRPDVLGGLP